MSGLARRGGLRRGKSALGAAEGEEGRYQAIVDTAVDAIAVIDEAGVISAFNHAAERLFGYRAAEIMGGNINVLMGDPEHERHDEYLERYRQTGRRWMIGASRQVLARRKDGTLFHMELSVAEWWAGGRRYFTGIMRDVTERARAEERQQLLVNELNHRVKNTLATVQALAGQTLRSSHDLEEARTSLTERLLALAKGHDVLTRASWVGADIADVVEAAMAAADHGRYACEGPRARLAPKAALALSMMLHELFTNALTYGSLSVDEGRVEMRWTRRRDDLTFVWRESGGPPVSRPTRMGFGSKMIDLLARDLDGEGALDFEPDGVVYTLRARLRPELDDEAPKRARRRG